MPRGKDQKSESKGRLTMSFSLGRLVFLLYVFFEGKFGLGSEFVISFTTAAFSLVFHKK